MKKIALLTAVLISIAIGYVFYTNRSDPSVKDLPTVKAQLNDQTFELYAPDTPAGLQKGLSVFRELPSDKGMIFRGLPVGTQTFWMKDMKFDIDIIWVNKDNKVVHVVYDVSKDSYPTRFENPVSQPSSYVIEINAGLADKYGIAPGTTVTIN